MSIFRLENLKKLSVQLAIGGGVVTYIMVNTIPYIMNSRLKETSIYKEALKMITSHPEAIKYMGEPIEDGHISVTKKDMYGSDNDKAWFTIPVRGPKSAGTVYCETKYIKSAEGENVKSELSKMELTLKNLPGYKLMIKRAE